MPSVIDSIEETSKLLTDYLVNATSYNDTQKTELYKKIKEVHKILGRNIGIPIPREHFAVIDNFIDKAARFSNTLTNGISEKAKEIVHFIRCQIAYLNIPVQQQPGHMEFTFGDEPPDQAPYMIPEPIVALLKSKTGSFFNAKTSKEYADSQKMHLPQIQRKYFELMLSHLVPKCKVTISPTEVFELYKTAHFFQMTELLQKYHEILLHNLSTQDKVTSIEFLFIGCLGQLDGKYEDLCNIAFQALIEQECRESFNSSYFEEVKDTRSILLAICEKEKISFDAFMAEAKKNQPQAASFFEHICQDLPDAQSLLQDCLNTELDVLTFIKKGLQLTKCVHQLPPQWDRIALRTAFTNRITANGQYSHCLLYLALNILNNVKDLEFANVVKAAAPHASNINLAHGMRINFLPTQQQTNEPPEDKEIFEIDPKLWCQWLKNRVLTAHSLELQKEIAEELKRLEETYSTGMSATFHKEFSLIKMASEMKSGNTAEACIWAKRLTLDDVFSLSDVARGRVLYFVELYLDTLISGGELEKAEDECIAGVRQANIVPRPLLDKLRIYLSLIHLYRLQLPSAMHFAEHSSTGPHMPCEADWLIPVLWAMQGHPLIHENNYTVNIPKVFPRTIHGSLFKLLNDIIGAHLQPDINSSLEALLPLYPNESLPRIILGHYAERQRKWSVALMFYNEAIRIQSNSSINLHRAYCYQEMGLGHEENVEKALDDCLKTRPEDPKAIALKADVILKKLGEPQARAYLTDKLQSNEPGIQIVYGKFLKDRGEYEAAKAVLEPFAQQNYPAALCHLSACERMLGHPFSAFSLGKRALDKDPNNPTYIELQIDNLAMRRMEISSFHLSLAIPLIATLERLTGQTERWQHYYFRTLQRLRDPAYDGRLSSYRALILEIPERFRKQPEIAELRYMHLQYHRYDGLTNLSEDIAALTPHLPHSVQEITPFFERYFLYDYELAIQEYVNNPGAFEGPYLPLVADCYRRLGDYATAQRVLRESREIPSSIVRAILYFHSNNLEISENSLKHCLREGCSLPFLTELAFCTFTRIQPNQTNFLDIHTRYYHTVDAQILMLEKQIQMHHAWENIVDSFRNTSTVFPEVLSTQQRFPEHPTYRFLVMKLYTRTQRFAEAKGLLEIFLAQNPNHREAHLLYGYCLVFFGNPQAALQHLRHENALDLKLSEDLFDYHYNVGLANYSLNLIPQALNAFQQAAQYEEDPANHFWITRLQAGNAPIEVLPPSNIGMDTFYSVVSTLATEQAIQFLNREYSSQDLIRSGLFALFHLAKCYAQVSHLEEVEKICRKIARYKTKYMSIYGKDFFEEVAGWKTQHIPKRRKGK